MSSQFINVRKLQTLQPILFACKPTRFSISRMPRWNVNGSARWRALAMCIGLSMALWSGKKPHMRSAWYKRSRVSEMSRKIVCDVVSVSGLGVLGAPVDCSAEYSAMTGSSPACNAGFSGSGSGKALSSAWDGGGGRRRFAGCSAAMWQLSSATPQRCLQC